ncbi:endocuticle structural glycoprotein SgAbd-4-like isoform X3 [Pollicipes pollicipes]|uniref:endocuticle structural glycoprotein SgAbd-4-like isoform X3 n=1 Tax=Pollicipes pollicipes TaxID=41117 RepID=UPI001884BE60|nr:endocuticle structural glycoprotein SgAbd-4-like isoform X3 [Pollicipes pollicipes]
MKLVIVLCLVALTWADKDAKIVNQQFQINEDGSYQAEHETSNGIRADENGVSFPGNEPETGNYVRSGTYSYDWEGVTYTVTWEADENGYYATGDHLP